MPNHEIVRKESDLTADEQQRLIIAREYLCSQGFAFRDGTGFESPAWVAFRKETAHRADD